MAHDIFISYSAVDKPIADAVCAGLENRGIRCWMAPRDILPGLDWGAAIIDAINDSRAMVLVFSSNANTSKQIKREVERAVSKGVTIVPLRIEDVPLGKTLEYFISTPHWLDAISPPLEGHIARLGDTIDALLSRPSRQTDAEIRKPPPGRAVAGAGGAAPARSIAPVPVVTPFPMPAPAPSAPGTTSRRRRLAIAAVAALALIGIFFAVAKSGRPPRIVQVDFPTPVYAGQPVNAVIHFEDKKGDVTSARIDVLQATSFQPVSIPTPGLAGRTSGQISIPLVSPVAQHVVLQAVLIDSSGKQSNAYSFTFDVQPAPASSRSKRSWTSKQSGPTTEISLSVSSWPALEERVQS